MASLIAAMGLDSLPTFPEPNKLSTSFQGDQVSQAHHEECGHSPTTSISSGIPSPTLTEASLPLSSPATSEASLSSEPECSWGEEGDYPSHSQTIESAPLLDLRPKERFSFQPRRFSLASIISSRRRSIGSELRDLQLCRVVEDRRTTLERLESKSLRCGSKLSPDESRSGANPFDLELTSHRKALSSSSRNSIIIPELKISGVPISQTSDNDSEFESDGDTVRPESDDPFELEKYLDIDEEEEEWDR